MTIESQQVSISEAARLVGRDRKSLYRDLKAGKLSATVGDSGVRQVAVSELLRVYGALEPIGDTRDSRETVSMPQPETADETQILKVKLAAAEAELAQMRERLSDKDKNLEDLRNAVRLLEYEPAPGLLARWFGKENPPARGGLWFKSSYKSRH